MILEPDAHGPLASIPDAPMLPEHRGYPHRLHHLPIPPPVWTAGEIDWEAPMVAIVGARRPSPYGMRTARRLASALCSSGVWIVSGLAMGIDAAAHIGALDATGRTLAVLGSGLDQVYPAKNRALYERVCERGGAMSAYPRDTPPRRHRFLERNALIASVSHAVIVIEGVHPTSGALSTAARARDLGREVLAVPGPIDAELSGGPNRLIRDGCAPCLDAADVLTALSAAGAPAPVRLSDLERRVLSALGRGRSAEQIAAATGVAAGQVDDILLDLDLRGLIKRDPMGAYAPL
ncbi:MAG: DNA-processing protein DprA [Actinomycetota bacterium]